MEQIICPSDGPFFQLPSEVPISFTEWKNVLLKLKAKETAKSLDN